MQRLIILVGAAILIAAFAIARAGTIIEGMRLNGQRFLTKQLKGEPLTGETSINMLHRFFLAIEFGELALEIQGSASQYKNGGGAPTGEAETPSRFPAAPWNGRTSSSGWYSQHPAQHHRRAHPRSTEGLVRLIHFAQMRPGGAHRRVSP
jgi:hypothetical protein